MADPIPPLAGFVHVGKASGFMIPLQPPTPTPISGSISGAQAGAKDLELDIESQPPSPPLAVAATTNAETNCVPEKGGCPVKGSGKDAYLIKVVEIPQPAGRYPPTRRVAVTYFHSKWYAFLNICPHQGSALSNGSMTDIEDMGIVWGAGVSCSLHGWTFDALSGQSDSTRFVVDTFDIKEIDGHLFVSEKPRNSNVPGPRRDFGGRELN
ncbi:hypothetical protein BG004_003664 [Podila humilis]|nr:hypothetical protein BG004_003664 [Podila humilis]